MRFAPLISLMALLLLGACGTVDMEPSRSSRGPSAAQAGSAGFFHATEVKVARGDTVYAISRRHKVPMRAIIDANKLKPPYALRIGQWLKLPRVAVHTVVRGDTLGRIARQYNAELATVARLNGLRSPYVIYPGQRLALPGGSAMPQVAAQPVRKTAKPTTSRTSREPSIRKAPVARPQPGQKVTITKRAPSAPKAVTAAPPRRSGNFVWPVRGQLLSGFGTKGKGLHNDGINISAKRGAPVKAAENGVVVYAGNELKGFGNLLLIKHAKGWVTAYAHNQDLLVKRGEKVKKGQRIARVGSSGGVTQPQLHFELRKGKTAIDPLKYLPRAVAKRGHPSAGTG
ncbi:M23 family metallopeptidase [Magnetospira sp. QH-2]|uniref:M23 family metallopeptidase n=1 Tax=Magnetospira sp. (strain QH-2) TaxID=1288970 RepID=UPI000697FCED|nr:M23 family metallopeptidase [Magnetospira sp. QH-2]